MRECANFCENRLICYLGTVNAALGTMRSFPPMFWLGSAKTGGIVTMGTQGNVKTDDEQSLAKFSAALADIYDDDLEWETIASAALDRCRLTLIEKIG